MSKMELQNGGRDSDSHSKKSHNNNNKNNKNNKPLRQSTITLKRKLADTEEKTTEKTTEPTPKRLKLMNKTQLNLSISKTNTISPSTTSNITTPSSTRTNKKKSAKTSCNLTQLPALLIPNTYLNFHRYKSKVAAATRRAKQTNTKRTSVTIGLDLRSYTSDDAGLTQIVNIIKGTSIKYKKRNQKGNWEKNLGLKSYLVKYLEIHGDQKMAELFREGINGQEFKKFTTLLKKKNYDETVKTFIMQAMKCLLQKMINKYTLTELSGQIQKEYIMKYGDDNDNDNNNNNNNNNNIESKFELYWPQYINKQTYDKNKASYLQKAYEQLDEEQEKENDSDMIEIDLEILITAESNDDNVM